MNEILSLYFSVQLLLSMAYLILYFAKSEWFCLSYSTLLKLTYAFVAISVSAPLAQLLAPTENPFGPIFKVWAEPAVATQLVPIASVNFRLPATAVTPQVSGALPSYFGLLLIVLITFVIGIGIYRLVRDYFRLNGLINDSVLLKGHGRVRVWLSCAISSPFSYFNGCANIVLPVELAFQPENRKLALAHELQHHRQKDTLWVYFLGVIKILFAFNPLVRKLIAQTSEFQEFACDEALVGHKRYSAQAYGKCLLEFAETQLQKQSVPISAVGMAVEAKLLKRRIHTMFMQQRKTSTKVFTTVLLLGGVTLSSAAWTFRGAVSDQSIGLKQAQKLAEKISANQEIPIVVDARVLHWLNRAVGSEKSRKYMREALQRKELYSSMITSKLEQASLPEELLAVPLVESGYRNKAYSIAKAAGMWQFIPGTAKKYGLVVPKAEDLSSSPGPGDDRLIPEKATDAAVGYYTTLYAIFQNWHVALAAYNIGERRMLNAIAEAGHNDALKLAREGKLGREGGNYLAKVIAGMIVMKNPELVQ